jgi:hypothetical protein
MRLENRSTRHETPKLLPLVEFAVRQAKYASLATLRLVDARKPDQIIGGYSWKFDPQVGDLTLVAPSLVKMTLSAAERYPRLQRARSGGWCRSSSQTWEEEFLLVLAHELRHVDQFWGERITDAHKAEVDAERFALRCIATISGKGRDKSLQPNLPGACPQNTKRSFTVNVDRRDDGGGLPWCLQGQDSSLVPRCPRARQDSPGAAG